MHLYKLYKKYNLSLEYGIIIIFITIYYYVQILMKLYI